MIGQLPKQLEVDRKVYDIRTDYRNCLLILEAFNDPDNTLDEAYEIMIHVLYKEIPDNIPGAIERAIWFLNCGDSIDDEKPREKPVYDWQKDEQMIFAEINKVAGHEVRADKYMHFWTFIGLFQGIGEGFFCTVVSIRQKLNRGKELDKIEQEFYDRNTNLIKLNPKRSKEEQEKYDFLNKLYS